MIEGSDKNFFRRYGFLILCALLCLPVFLLNIKNSHDWGDDFAQYILQAKNIVEHKPQTQTGYIYNETLTVFAPPAYPAGFPLMLAGVYALKGNSIRAFNYLITSVLFFLCLLMFWFFRKHFSGLAALFLVLIFAYSPWTLGFKTEILSDFPFALFFLLSTCFYLYGKNSLLIDLLCGISCGLMLSIRGVAAVFLIALLLHIIYLLIREKKAGNSMKALLKKLFVIFGSSVAVYFLLNHVFVKVPTGKFLEFYSHAYEKYSVGEIIIQNLNYYAEVFEAYFDPGLEKWTFITVVSKSFSLVLLLIGMLHCLLCKRSFIDLLVWVYILLFIVYPYTAGGFRFILPVFPFLLYYMVIGLKHINITIHANRKILIAAGGLFVLMQYRHGISEIIKYQPNILQGPQEPASVEVFEYIKKSTPESSIVLFKKPKALALYTGRKTTSTAYYQSSSDVKNMLRLIPAGYLLLNQDNDPELGDEPLKKYLDDYKDDVQLIWQNNKFLLYKRTEQ